MDKVYSDLSIHNCPYTYKSTYWKEDFTFSLIPLNPHAVSSILLFPFSLSASVSESEYLSLVHTSSEIHQINMLC